MKDFKKNYKKAFLESINQESELEKVKERLEFNNNSPIKLASPKRPIIITSLSFVLVAILVATISVIFIFGNKNIPTYTGMEIVDYTNVVKMARVIDDDDDDDDDDDIASSEADSDAPTIETKDEISYYAHKGETITIAIHINNPKQYEILSFILDGYKYQSFMFKEGSTSEVIYVDLTCQNESGIQTIFIDELKYIDGTKTKLARYDGDQTIKVGVTYDNAPEIVNTVEAITENSYKLDFALADPDNLVTEESFYSAYLLENGKIIKKEKLNKATKSISFSDLKMNTTYKVYIYAGVDLLDGKGYTKLLILKNVFKTKSGLSNEAIASDYEALSFSATPIRSDVKIIGAKLYNGSELVKELRGDAISFTEINSDTAYRLEVSYEYLLNDNKIIDTISYEAKTLKYAEPKFEGLVLYSKEDKAINLDLEFIDPFNIVKEYTIEVYGDNELITTTNDLLAFIEVTKSYNEIKVVVKAQLDFRDGKGALLKEYSERG